jgi:hypothetical protein
MDFTIEMNNIQRDSDRVTAPINKNSAIVEIFSAMTQGKDLSNVKQADKGVTYIKGLAQRANCGDYSAMAEMNAIRIHVLEPILLNELKLLSFMGNYQAIGYNETVYARRAQYVGEKSRFQALNGDVPFPVLNYVQYPVTTVAVSGGYVVDYRKVQFGDMSDENIGMEQVRVEIRNKAAAYALYTIYNSIKNATGVKFFSENAGLVKSELDRIIKDVRRFGKVTIVGDYAVVSQINGFVGYDGTNPAVLGISEEAMNEIRRMGLIGSYNGALVTEIENMFDISKPLATNDGFETIFPQSLLFVLPTGAQSPISTWTRGGLTSLTGTDVQSGKYLTRFDLEVAADVEKGGEYKIGLINDLNLQQVAY